MTKLEDMMNHYSLTGTEIPGEPLADAEKERILTQTLKKAGLKASSSGALSAAGQAAANPSAHKSRRRIWTMTAACILILAMVTVSFAAIALDKNFFTFFNAHDQSGKELLENLGTLINKQVTDNGMTLNVREAVGDGNSVNILFDLTAPEGTLLNSDYYSFASAWIDLPENKQKGAGYYFEQLTDDNPADNKITMMLCYDTDANLSGKTMRFRFSNLMAPKSAEEIAMIQTLPQRDEPGTTADEYDSDKVVYPGTWEIQFPLNYKDASTVIKPKVDVKLLGGPCKITQARYSPISVSLTIKGDSLRQADTMAPDQLLAKCGADGAVDQQIDVTLANGRVVATSGTASTISGNKLTLTCHLSEVIDPAEIVSISYAGAVIDLSK